MNPFGRISLKNTKKPLSWSYCKMVYDTLKPIINRRDPSNESRASTETMKKMELTSSSGIYKIIYHNGSHLEKESCIVLGFYGDNSSYFEKSVSLF